MPSDRASSERGPLIEPHPVIARGLTKRFGTLTAVAGVDFDVRAGECLGVLGPNGAGKTTTVKMITCFSPITEGEVHIFGLNVTQSPREVKALLGICPQEDNLDPDFSVRRNLLVYGRYFGIPEPTLRRRADELLELVALTEKARADVSTLSGGMKRRLVLARALLNEPRLLVLDEPTTGLDPQARQAIWQRVRQLRAGGVTVLLTTHYMEEASQLCDRVLLMHGGKIVLEGPPKTLVESEVGREVVELWNVLPEVRRLIGASDWPHEETEDRLYLNDRVGGVIAAAIQEHCPEQERLIRHATLEDVFLRRTGRSLSAV